MSAIVISSHGEKIDSINSILVPLIKTTTKHKLFYQQPAILDWRQIRCIIAYNNNTCFYSFFYSFKYWREKKAFANQNKTKIVQKMSFKISNKKIGLWTVISITCQVQVYYFISDHIKDIWVIGGGNQFTHRKPPTCHKSLTNFIT